MLNVKLAIASEADHAADDVPMAGLVVHCSAVSAGGGSLLDAHSAVGGGDWRTATLRVDHAYPAQTPCVEFQSDAVRFGSRQASTCCSILSCAACWLVQNQLVPMAAAPCVVESFPRFEQC